MMSLKGTNSGKEVIIAAFTLMLLLLILLIFDITTDDFLIEANRIHKVAPRPKVIPPIGLLLQTRITLEQFDCQLALEKSHERADGQLRRNRTDQVDVILLNAQFDDLDLFPLTQRVDVLLQVLLDHAFENAKTVLRRPNDVIVALVDNMGKLAIFTLAFCHPINLRHSRTDITIAIGEGFLH